MISSIKEGKYEAEKEAVALLYEGVGVESVVSQAVGWGVRYLYVTDRPKATPWDTLPQYWEELVLAV